MEISGVISRNPPCFSGGGLGDHQTRREVSLRPCRRSINVVNGLGGVVNKDVDTTGFSFRDRGHLKYFYGSEGLVVRCGGRTKEKKKDKETSTKKKLKLLKELSKHYSPHDDALVGDVHPDLIISEATELLMKQLEHLRAEEKELKKKKKEEKAKLKAAKMKTCESSESSESECEEEVNIDMNRPCSRNEVGVAAVAERVSVEQLQAVGEGDEPTWINGHLGESCGGGQSSNNAVRAVSGSFNASTMTNRIEVCMGGKCKKSGGGVALLEQFERAVAVGGIEGAVVGCKCMGKCRDGPNVRVVDSSSSSSMAPPQPNPHLCIGFVGLEDVDVIVANYFGKDVSVALAT